MKWLEKMVQAVLVICICLLCGYIILRGVTIAGENGLFRSTPVLSAIYRTVGAWTTDTVTPVISYVKETPQEETGSLSEMLELTLPLAKYVSEQKEMNYARESQSEYELILQAEAAAEENKQPVEKSELPQSEREMDAEENLYDFQYLLYHYFSMDVTTTIDAQRLDGRTLLSMDMTMEKKPDAPQILIYHTHSQEAFADSVEGDESTTIVGVGDYLTQILTEEYGYEVIHERGVFDLVDGVLDRNLAYDLAQEKVKAWLEAYPSIEVVIDLHRDGVDGTKFVTEYEGRPAAKLMYIVGMSRTADNVDISYLPNPYVEENLAFALQLQLAAEEMQDDLMRNIYLMAYRFNMHLKPKSILLEAGTQLNTLQEEKNAMNAFAKVLDKVLRGV